MVLRSIRSRMTVTFALAIAILMLLVSSLVIWYFRDAAERDADRVVARTVGKVRTELAEGRERHRVGRVLDEEMEDARSENVAAVVIDRKGRVILSIPKAHDGAKLAAGDGWRTSRFRVGSDTVVIGVPWAKTEAELRDHSIALLSLGMFVVILAAAGAWVLVGRTLSPIAALSHQASTASADSLSIHLEEPSQDAEIAGLVVTLNGLLSRLAETATAKGRFYSAASHELRTPLQALLGHLDLALTKDRTNDEYRATVEEAHRQADRLASLVQSLLLLYQLESASSPPPSEPVDLALAVTNALDQYQSIIHERGLILQTHLPAEAMLAAPPTHVDVLVRNLIENAAKYADEGSILAIGLDITADCVKLTVMNQCSRAAWDSDRLFEPFARFDRARNRQAGGTGLGLAICKAVAEANGWQMDLRRDGRQVVATVVAGITPSDV